MKKIITACVDRIEGDFAVLYCGDDGDIKVDFPVELLPKDIGDGDYLRFEIEKDDDAAQNALDEAAALLEEIKKMNEDEE